MGDKEKREEKIIIENNEGFNLFFNLVVSQLLIAGIASLIEFLRILTINVLSKYFLSEYTIRKYGVYFQPIVTGVLLFIIGFFIYYLVSVMKKNNNNNGGSFLYYVLVFILFFMIICYVIFFISKLKFLHNKINLYKMV